MRDIEFRAWDKITKQICNVMAIDFNHEKTQIAIPSGKNGYKCSVANWRKFDEVVLMQYTGLKDKNGTKIFEGDVILFQDEKWVCVWSKDKWLFDSNKQKGQWMTWALNESEVIGNIHESEVNK